MDLPQQGVLVPVPSDSDQHSLVVVETQDSAAREVTMALDHRLGNTEAAAFDRKMAVALQAESHFCESVVDVGGEGKPRRACHVGFDVPRGVATDRDCEAMRAKNGDSNAFEARFDRRSPVGGEKRAPA